MRLRTRASRYVLVGRQVASTSEKRSKPKNEWSAHTAVARAAHYVDEALRGGLLGELAEADNEELLDSEDGNLLSTGSEVEERGSDDTLLSSGDEVDEPMETATSSWGLSEQLIALKTYSIKKNLKLIPEIHAALDGINHRDLEDSVHRGEYEKYADELELLTTRTQAILRRAGPSVPPTQVQTVQSQLLSQHNTARVPIPASPERRQYRKDSRSIH
ncbi:unnamed protein product [Rhizoctonia solani]|uniref:Uncharacterized protein n=1 Tax=Rhizoctonia solani TaxID=456999 RepID=A0A8H3AQF5_9AGAM|nr:unnamed protein product [Rhizoctonia solani]